MWHQAFSGAAVLDALGNRLTRGVLVDGDNRRIHKLQHPAGCGGRLQAVERNLVSLCCNESAAQAGLWLASADVTLRPGRVA